MAARFIIYALVDPRDGAWRYIGYSTSGMRRPLQHALPAHLARAGSHKGNWIRALHAIGLSYMIEVLEELPSSEACPEAEREWIAEAKRQGVRLTNTTDGGEGMLNPVPEVRAKMGTGWKGKHLPERIRRAISKAAKERVGEKNPFFGRKHSEGTRNRISEAAKKRVGSRNSFFGKTHSIEALAKMSRKAKGRVTSEETRRRMSESHKRRGAGASF